MHCMLRKIAAIILTMAMAQGAVAVEGEDTMSAISSSLPADTIVLPNRTKTYTPNAPLVYEDVSDLAPYSFMDENGEPAGYNIELVEMIMQALKIPYEIHLKPTPQNFIDVEEGKADLTIGMKAPYHDRYGAYSQNAITMFAHSLVYPKDLKVEVNSFEDLGKYYISGHKGSYSDYYMHLKGLGDHYIPVEDMKGLLMRITDNDTTIVLWNTLALRRLMNQYRMDHLAMAPVQMPYGQYHFITNDSVLLHSIDSVFNELNRGDALSPIKAKWLYGAEEKRTPPYMWWIVGIAAVVLIVVLTYNVVYRVRDRQAKEKTRQQTKRLGLLLQSGNMQVWTYDTRTEKYITLDSNTLDYEEHAEQNFANRYDREDFRAIQREIGRMETMGEDSVTLSVRRTGYGQEESKIWELNLSVLHRDEMTKKPVTILGTQKDITGERLKYRETRETLLKYETVFNTAMADLAYYDEEGTLMDINDKACETFNIRDRQAFIKTGIKLWELPVFRHLEQEEIKEGIWASTLVDHDELEEEGQMPKLWEKRGQVYFEFSIRPVKDEEGNIMCYISAGRDVTTEAKQMDRERRRRERIKDTTAEIAEYTRNINYALQNGRISLANYYIDRRTMVVTQDTGNRKSLEISQLKCVQMLDPEFRMQAAELLMRMDKRTLGEFDIRVKMKYPDKKGRAVWFDINGLPMKDNHDRVDHYFCLCRESSVLVEAEMQLEAETKRAQEAEGLKTSFFNNMSREIRTPLSTVVGFADMFKEPHSKEEEQLFSNEIKTNSDILLELVNSILLLSRLDANMVEYKPVATDFPEMFRTYCMMGWTRGLSQDVSTMVESPYRQLKLDIDPTHVGMIIQDLAAMAASHTQEGQIRARYVYREGQLTITVEDTGEGMPKSIVKDIMNRTFRSDEGQYIQTLKMEIMMGLAELMGGKMGVESELGQGTTIWVTIPCKLSEETGEKSEE